MLRGTTLLAWEKFSKAALARTNGRNPSPATGIQLRSLERLSTMDGTADEFDLVLLVLRFGTLRAHTLHIPDR
jgi:hypothetical protein